MKWAREAKGGQSNTDTEKRDYEIESCECAILLPEKSCGASDKQIFFPAIHIRGCYRDRMKNASHSSTSWF